MITVDNLAKSFGGKRALDGLSLHVPPGAVYGLVGPNGAGKTTVLQHVSGVYRPESGSVLVGGDPVFENPAAKERIAYIPSDFYYYRQANVGDMRRLHAALYANFDHERFDKIGEAFGIDESTNVRALSRGMKKQVAFWLALAQRPDVLLLDEPLDGLDPAVRRMVLGVVMQEVADHGMTVLVSSHNLRELADICDYVGIMESGRMRLERSLADLQEGFVKVQAAFANENATLPGTLDVVHSSVEGKLHSAIVRGSAEQAEHALAEAGATFANVLPLTLEEIFIYELGGSDHAFGILD